MSDLEHLLSNNREWASDMTRDDPDFFQRLSRQQAPACLWIGCSDSRVPANQIVGLPPGEMFVHRNVANVVAQGDLNFLSVLQFAVDVLRVDHVIVCGHYGCGGVHAALHGTEHELVEDWLRPVRAVGQKHRRELDALETEEERHDRLCELNVVEQVANVGRTAVVGEAWRRGQSLTVHGWIYGLEDGLLRDLKFGISSEADLQSHEGATNATGATDTGEPLDAARAADATDSGSVQGRTG